MRLPISFSLLLLLLSNVCTSNSRDPLEGFRLALELEVKGAEVSEEQAREYCIEALGKHGIRVLSDISSKEAHEDRIPLLVIRRAIGEDSETRYDYRTETTLEYWDTMQVKRNPVFEQFQKIFFSSGGTHFDEEDLGHHSSWPGIQEFIDHQTAIFTRIIRPLLEGKPEDLERMAPDFGKKQ